MDQMDQVPASATAPFVNAHQDMQATSGMTAMGDANEELALNSQPPAVVLMAGLQGAGKTTSVGKLAKF